MKVMWIKERWFVITNTLCLKCRSATSFDRFRNEKFNLMWCVYRQIKNIFNVIAAKLTTWLFCVQQLLDSHELINQILLSITDVQHDDNFWIRWVITQIFELKIFHVHTYTRFICTKVDDCSVCDDFARNLWSKSLFKF